jgi:hypothetical protein
MNRASIGATSFRGSGTGCPVSRASASVGKRVAMHDRREFDSQLHRLLVDDSTELKLYHVPPLTFVRLEHEVAVDDHAHRKPGPDRQCWLGVKIALNDFLSGLV